MTVEQKIRARMKRIKPTYHYAPRFFRFLLFVAVVLNLTLLLAIKVGT